MERPAMQGCSLAASGPYPVANALQIFQGYSACGALRSINKLLADLVVDMFGKASLFAGELFKATTTSLRTFGLQLFAQAPMAKAYILDLTTAMHLAITIDGNVSNPQINAKKIIGIVLVRLCNIASLIKIELAIAVNQICLTLAIRQQLALMVTTDERHCLPTIKRPERKRVTAFPGKNPVVIGNATQRLESAFGLAIKLVAIRHFGNNTNGHLSRQAKPLADGIVSGMVQVKLPKRLRFPSKITQVISCGIRSFQCLLQAFRLCFRGLQFDLRYQFQLDRLLILYVLLNHRQRCAADCGNKITICPQGRKPAATPIKFFS